VADDPFDLERFLWAQESTLEAVRRELGRGRKTSHWMWFIFPQVAGLGRSATAQRYAIRSAAEARAYLAHPLLGERLRECCELLLTHRGQEPESILGHVDAIKLRSSMTLFDSVSKEPVFGCVLAAFYDGCRDFATESVLQSWGEAS
jgi:uncharacterized protein (DUF1810 family)